MNKRTMRVEKLREFVVNGGPHGFAGAILFFYLKNMYKKEYMALVRENKK